MIAQRARTAGLFLSGGDTALAVLESLAVDALQLERELSSGLVYGVIVGGPWAGRPVVIRDAAQSDALSIDRYDLMRTKQQNAQPTPSSLVPVNEAPVMPQLTRPAPPINTQEPLKPAPATTAPSVR